MAKGKYEAWIGQEGLAKIADWARNGLTDEQSAKIMRNSRSTLEDWKKKYPDISDTLKREKIVVDAQVENALLRRALGYRYTEERKELRFNKKTGRHELTITKVVEKEVAPDTTAAIFWLKNRRPDVWRDKQNLEISALEDDKDKLDDLIRQMRGDGE